MGVNFQEIYSADPFASGGTQDAYRRRLLAAQLLQKKASEDDKVFSNQHGGMKLATALLGGMMEGWEEKKAKQGQAAVGRDLAGALASAGVSPGGMGSISAPSAPSGGSPAGAPSLAGSGVARTMTMPAEFGPLFAETEKKYGLPEGYLSRTAEIESKFNPNAKNPNSSASGLFQFINSTARQYGLADPFDPAASTDAAARLAADNAAGLKRVLGRDPTSGELYLAHQQGLGGASKLLGNPNASVASLVGRDAARLNAGGNMTAGEFVKQWTGKFGGAPQQIASADPGFMPGPLSEADAGLPPEVAAATPAPVEQPPAPAFIPATDPRAPQDTSEVPYPEQVQQKNPAVQVAGPAPEFDPRERWQDGRITLDPPPPPQSAPLPPERPPETYTPRAPRVPPQAMAQALMAGGGQQIDPNSNNAGAQQFAASGMGRAPQNIPQNAPQYSGAPQNRPQNPSAPAGMYGAPGQAPAPPAQVAASAPTQYAQAGPAQQQRPAMDPRAAHALRVINSPWATAGQISAAQIILKQLQPDIQLIPTADGHVIAVDKHNPGKGATSVYKAPEKGISVNDEIRSPTSGQTIGPGMRYTPLVTEADRAKYGIHPEDPSS
jgi:hypothetical protein